jgi:transcriptional regulator with XRE-family HTH domain
MIAEGGKSEREYLPPESANVVLESRVSDEASIGKGPGSAAARLAAEVRRRREAAKLSQSQLADRIGFTRQYASHAERLGKNLPSVDLIRAVDGALDAGGELLRLREEAKVEQQIRRGVATGRNTPGRVDRHEEIQADLQRLRRVLNAHDLREDGAARPVDLLDGAVARLTDWRLQARYAQIAREVPDLLADIFRAMRATGVDRRRVSATLALAYRAADGLAFKFGYTDLSARLIELMRQAALDADDALLSGAVAYVRTEIFFADGDLTSAARCLINAADGIPAKALSKPSGVATYGSLHMRAAVVAARSGETDTARDHLSEARLMADRVPEGVYYGTAFGPASVRIHDVAVAVDLGDAPTAVERAGAWRPPQELPAERQSHYFIDKARAEVEIGLYDNAHDALRTARLIAPQHVREHPHVRQSLATLMRTRRRKDVELANFASWVGLTTQ